MIDILMLGVSITFCEVGEDGVVILSMGHDERMTRARP